MFLRAEHPVDPAVQGVMLYMYSPDLLALHAELQRSGVAPPPISYPGYMPSGEMQLRDPDGYSVIVAHWEPNEQEARAADKGAAPSGAKPRNEYRTLIR